MALKILTDIGTDKGITSEAYIRIFDYQVSKKGVANFKIELFLSEDEKNEYENASIDSSQYAKNKQIGDSITVKVVKDVEEIKIVNKPIENVIDAVLDEDGKIIEPARKEWIEEEVEETYTKQIVDLTEVEELGIFQFGYKHLKLKLQDLFGNKNVIDC
jgi:hypothetical protein